MQHGFILHVGEKVYAGNGIIYILYISGYGHAEGERGGQVWNPGVSYEHFAAPRQEGTAALSTMMQSEWEGLRDRWAEKQGIAPKKNYFNPNSPPHPKKETSLWFRA